MTEAVQSLPRPELSKVDLDFFKSLLINRLLYQTIKAVNYKYSSFKTLACSTKTLQTYICNLLNDSRILQ